MDSLLVLLGLAGLVFGLVNLARPTGRLGVSSRTAAGWLTAGSVVVIMLGAPSEPSADDETLAAPTTVVSTTTTVESAPPTTDPGTTANTAVATSTTGAEQPGAAAARDPEMETATVAAVTDGDTLDVHLDDGGRDTVRLIGINAPESGECWALEAGLALEEMLPPGTEIGMTTDQSNRDDFGRLLRYLWVGSASVNEELVRAGAAISRRYPPDTAMAETLEAAQTEAESEGAGLWGPDACGPGSDADLAVVELRYDAAGNDNENLNDEWIVILNQGDDPIDLTGWGIKDESATNRYRFPSGLVIEPGATVTIHTGCGQGSGATQFWCSKGSAVWNNDGDTAFLLDPEGNTHFSYTYSP